MAVKITSRSAGFRRCGIAHPAQPTTYQDGTFDEKQLAILQAEPMLIVEVIPEEPQGDPEPTPKEQPAQKSQKKLPEKPDKKG